MNCIPKSTGTMGGPFTAVAKGLAALALFASLQPAAAATITFDLLPGADGDPFTSFVEAGFAVNQVGSGGPCVDTTGGNPAPSLSVRPACAAFGRLVFAAGGSAFTFAGFDRLHSGIGEWSVTGSLNGLDVYSDYSVIYGGAGTSPWINQAFSAVLVDKLTLEFSSRGAPVRAGIDNVQLTLAVPEVDSAALLLAGLGLLVAFTRRAAGSRRDDHRA